jgi:lactoylglutathione lyase
MNFTQHGVILFTEEYEACVAFYGQTLGLPQVSQKEGFTHFAFGDGYLLVESGGIAHGREKTREENPTILRFNVESMDEAAQELRDKGVPVEVVSFDWGIVGVFSDPDGHRCELHASR